MSDSDDYSHLPVGSVVGGYEILSVLGSGGFGVTYLAVHQTLGRKVALKECLPLEIAWRRGDRTVGPRSSGRAGDFDWAKKRFMEEAKTLAQFSHESVVHVHDVFEANGTAYMPTGYVEGMDLEAWLDSLGRSPSEEELLPLIGPLLEGLELVHRGGVLHRDISPDNIFVTDSGRPVLLDFGSARQMAGRKTKTVVLKHGYAPFEQYQERGNQGAWTDVYAFCAVLHRCLTGSPPPTATDRVVRDPYEPLEARLKGKYSPELLRAIDSGLVVDEEKRPQSVEKFRDLLGKPFGLEPHGALPIANTEEQVKEGGKAESTRMRSVLMGLGAVLVAMLFWVFANQEKTGSIQISTNPAGAKVTIDGLGSGNGPYSLSDVAPGSYEAKIDKEGYVDRRVRFQVNSGAKTDLGVLDLEKETGVLLLSTAPTEANVMVGSTIQGKDDSQSATAEPLKSSPNFRESLIPGLYTVSIEKMGYDARLFKVEIKPGEETDLGLIELEPISGSISITTDPTGAEVEIPGLRTGTSPFEVEQVKPGQYQVKISKDGFEEKLINVEVSASKTAETGLIKLEPKLGGIEITSTPSGASVEVVGLGRGTTPFKLEKVIAGQYWAVVSKEGFLDSRFEFKVSAGEVARSGPVILTSLKGMVVLDSSPQGAKIVDLSEGTGGSGKQIGYTPLRINGVSSGRKVYSFELDGYNNVLMRGILKAGDELRLSAAFGDQRERVEAPLKSSKYYFGGLVKSRLDAETYTSIVRMGLLLGVLETAESLIEEITPSTHRNHHQLGDAKKYRDNLMGFLRGLIAKNLGEEIERLDGKGIKREIDERWRFAEPDRYAAFVIGNAMAICGLVQEKYGANIDNDAIALVVDFLGPVDREYIIDGDSLVRFLFASIPFDQNSLGDIVVK